jgi:hypothetical protein
VGQLVYNSATYFADDQYSLAANEYWDTFFATYTAFATADEILKSLVRRFGVLNVVNPQIHAGLRMT